MPKPVFRLPVTGSAPKVATKQALEAAIQAVIDPLYAMSGDNAAEIEAAAAAGQQYLADAQSLIETQLNAPLGFPSVEKFRQVRAIFDFWAVGSFVVAGGQVFQKRLTSGGTAWVRVGSDADRLQNHYIEDVPGAVEWRHLPAIPAGSMLSNIRNRDAPARAVTIEDVLKSVGMKWFGETASGGMSLPLSAAVPNAANALRQARGTSLAGVTPVTFHTPFAPCTPIVRPSAIAIDAADAPLHANVIANTSDRFGFSVVIKNAAGTAVAREFEYLALGQDDI